MSRETRGEVHTGVCCVHPYYGFVCTPSSRIDFSESVPAAFGHGAIADIDEEGFRNSQHPARRAPDETWVGLFGGSVAFSVASSSNASTISSYLEAELNSRRGAAAPRARFRVINFALPGGQQPQQLAIFLAKRHLLDAIVTFDGVNEIVVPTCYNAPRIPDAFPYRPYYEALYGRTITDEQIALAWGIADRERRLASLPAVLRRIWAPCVVRAAKRARLRLQALSGSHEFVSLFSGDRELSVDERITAGVARWSDGIGVMDQLCRGEGRRALFILQPIPDRGKRLAPSERDYLAAQPDVVAIRARGYQRLRDCAAKLAAAGLPVVDFGEVFNGITDPVYTDLVHFEDTGCRVVAQAIAHQLEGPWAWAFTEGSYQRG